MKSKNINFTDLFDPDIVGDGPTAPGYMVGGVPLKFAAIKYGSKRADVGYAEKGVDVSNKWAAKGTASYNDAIVIPFGNYQARATGSHDVDATWALTLTKAGTWAISQSVNGQSNSTSGTPLAGSWHVAPSSDVGNDYEVRFTASASLNNTFTGSANPSYSASTGWLALSASRTVEVKTTHMLGGAADDGGNIIIAGNYKVEIRKIGGTQIKTSIAEFDVEGICS